MSSEKKDKENTVDQVHSSQFLIRMLKVSHRVISRRVLKKEMRKMQLIIFIVLSFQLEC